MFFPLPYFFLILIPPAFTTFTDSRVPGTAHISQPCLNINKGKLHHTQFFRNRPLRFPDPSSKRKEKHQGGPQDEVVLTALFHHPQWLPATGLPSSPGLSPSGLSSSGLSSPGRLPSPGLPAAATNELSRAAPAEGREEPRVFGRLVSHIAVNLIFVYRHQTILANTGLRLFSIAAICCCWLCGETCECCFECLECCF